MPNHHLLTYSNPFQNNPYLQNFARSQGAVTKPVAAPQPRQQKAAPKTSRYLPPSVNAKTIAYDQPGAGVQGYSVSTDDVGDRLTRLWTAYKKQGITSGGNKDLFKKIEQMSVKGGALSAKEKKLVQGYIKTGKVDGLSTSLQLRILDGGLREAGRKQQTKDSWLDTVTGFVKGALPAVAGSLILPGVGSALGASLSAAQGGAIAGALAGGLTSKNPFLGAALGGVSGYGIGNLTNAALQKMGIGAFNNVPGAGFGTGQGLAGGEVGLTTGLANAPSAASIGGGFGAGALGPTASLAGYAGLAPGVYEAGKGMVGGFGLPSGTTPWSGVSGLPGGGFVNPGALSGTTQAAINNTLNAGFPITTATGAPTTLASDNKVNLTAGDLAGATALLNTMTAEQPQPTPRAINAGGGQGGMRMPYNPLALPGAPIRVPMWALRSYL